MKGWIEAGLLCLLVTAAASGCSQHRRTYLSDGRQGVMITCRRMTQSWGKCLAEAGRTCGSAGYVTEYENELDRELIVGCRAPKN
jgi:hypothetical protein